MYPAKVGSCIPPVALRIQTHLKMDLETKVNVPSPVTMQKRIGMSSLEKYGTKSCLKTSFSTWGSRKKSGKPLAWSRNPCSNGTDPSSPCQENPQDQVY